MLRGLGQHIIAERKLQRRQADRRVRIQLAQFLDEDPETTRIGNQQVHAEVDAGQAAVEQRRPYIEERPAVGRQHLVRHLRPHRLQPGSYRLGELAAQVKHRQLKRRHVLQDLLTPVGQHDHAQHVMTLDQLLPGPAKAHQVGADRLEFHVAVGGHIAHFEIFVPPDPIRLLHIGERERVVAVRRVRGHLGHLVMRLACGGFMGLVLRQQLLKQFSPLWGEAFNPSRQVCHLRLPPGLSVRREAAAHFRRKAAPRRPGAQRCAPLPGCAALPGWRAPRLLP